LRNLILQQRERDATNEMYIILDNSFSMQAKGKQGELLKRAVQELLEETPENTTSLLTNSENFLGYRY
jgi:pantothenate synthetase